MIPHIIHGIWLGGDPLPERWRRCWESWGEYHPHWQQRLWGPESLPRDFDFYGATDLRQCADILRYQLILEHGGFYVDMDFECLRPIDKIIETTAAFAAREDDRHQAISIGILGAVKFHPTFWRIVKELPESIQKHQAIGDQTGPAFLTRIVRQWKLPLTVFPATLFYPYQGSDAMNGIPFDPASAPEAYAVHHWASLTKAAA